MLIPKIIAALVIVLIFLFWWSDKNDGNGGSFA